MNKQLFLVPVLGAALLLSACEGDTGLAGPVGATGLAGPPGEDGFNTLSVFRDIEIGDAACLGGGIAVDSGLDLDRDGVLDAGEITDTFITECAVTPVLRALHASPDAPDVDVVVDGTAALEGVPFPVGSGFLPVGLAENVTEFGVSVDILVNALLPDDVEAPALTADDVFLPFDTETTVIASGDVDDGLPLTGIVIQNPLGEDITAGRLRVQVVHGADDAPPVNVYVTLPEGDLVDPVNGGELLAYESFTPQLEIAEGTYRIRIEAIIEGTPTVVYDSGAAGIDLAAGADLMIVAIDNAYLGETPVELVVLDGTGSFSIPDANIGAAALAVHLSPDAGPVDVLADAASTPDDDALLLVDNVSYTDFCVIGDNIAPDDYALSVVGTGTTESVFDFDYSAVAGEATALVVGGLAADLTAIALPIPVRFMPLVSMVRLTHGAPSTGNVDIYLLPAGGDIEAADPDFADVPFGASTPVLTLTPNTYDIYVTATGSKTPAIDASGFPLGGGDSLDIFARDPVDLEVGPQALIVNYDGDLALCIPET